MSRYRITVGRRVYQTTTVLVTNETRKKAENAAIAKASKDHGLAWDTTADEATTVYFVEATTEEP